MNYVLSDNIGSIVVQLLTPFRGRKITWLAHSLCMTSRLPHVIFPTVYSVYSAHPNPCRLIPLHYHLKMLDSQPVRSPHSSRDSTVTEHSGQSCHTLLWQNTAMVTMITWRRRRRWRIAMVVVVDRWEQWLCTVSKSSSQLTNFKWSAFPPWRLWAPASSTIK